MIQLDLTADITAATQSLSDLQLRHAPFATARALTDAARDARDAVRADLPHRFNIRKPWVAKGINIEGATKSHLVAHVFSRDAFMSEQEDGGTRAKSLARAIPVGRLGDVHQNKVIPQSQRPRALLAKKNVFYQSGKIFERRGKNIETLYLIRKSVRIRPRFGMALTVRSVALRVFARYFEDRLIEALGKN